MASSAGPAELEPKHLLPGEGCSGGAPCMGPVIDRTVNGAAPVVLEFIILK